MILVRHKTFRKHYKLRILPNPVLDKKFAKRLKQFVDNPRSPILKDHKLTGTLEGLRSFSVGGDMRVVYRQYADTIELYDIGSHNQVY